MGPYFSATETTVFWDGKYSYFADCTSGAAVRMGDSHVISAIWPTSGLFHSVGVGPDKYAECHHELLKSAMRYQRSHSSGRLLRVPAGHSVIWGSFEFFNIRDLIAVSPEASRSTAIAEELDLADVRALSLNAQVKFDRMSSSVRIRLVG
jgi:hypothetical protein